MYSTESDVEFNHQNIMKSIVNVTNWRALGLQFGFSSAKLNEFEGDEPKQKMITEWMQDPEASWERLEEALKSPALDRAAGEVSGASFNQQITLEQQTSSDKSGW